MEDRFKITRRFTVVVLLAIFTLCIASLMMMGSDAVPVLSIAIPTMGGLTGAYTHTTNRKGG